MEYEQVSIVFVKDYMEYDKKVSMPQYRDHNFYTKEYLAKYPNSPYTLINCQGLLDSRYCVDCQYSIGLLNCKQCVHSEYLVNQKGASFIFGNILDAAKWV